eukprot:5110667-Heterocapsa_arctica.AAC.1
MQFQGGTGKGCEDMFWGSQARGRPGPQGARDQLPGALHPPDPGVLRPHLGRDPLRRQAVIAAVAAAA